MSETEARGLPPATGTFLAVIVAVYALLAFSGGDLDIDPELILAIFLPPILYADAFDTSWVGFQGWLRPILMLAIGLVAATILAVGLAALALMPELPWAVCFVIGRLARSAPGP